MTKRTNRRPENLVKHNGGSQCRLTREDRACGFHQGQSTRMLANRPVIVTQSYLRSSPPQPLQLRASPYSCVVPRATTAIDVPRCWRAVGTNTGLAVTGAAAVF